MGDQDKAMQPDCAVVDGDPEVLDPEADAEAIDIAWVTGKTVTPDGYLDRPVWP